MVYWCGQVHLLLVAAYIDGGVCVSIRSQRVWWAGEHVRRDEEVLA